MKNTFDQAATLIRTQGWWAPTIISRGGSHCISTAIHAVHKMHLWELKREQEELDRLCGLLLSIIDEQGFLIPSPRNSARPNWSRVVEWHDMNSRTADHVLGILGIAAERYPNEVIEETNDE